MKRDKVQILGFVVGGLAALGIYMFVGVVWVLLEKAILGAANPNNVDVIIGVILTTSLFFNLMTCIKKAVEEHNN